jgi:hypothetical protein
VSAVNSAASQQAVVEAALVLLERMGLSPADLAAVPQDRPVVPTFGEYVPVVSAAVSPGTRRAYGSCWNRIVEHWGSRRLDEPTPSEIRQLMVYVKDHVVARRNARGGRSAQEHLVAALRCLYRRAVDDGLISEADNPARKVAKPRRLPTTRRALPDARLAGPAAERMLTIPAVVISPCLVRVDERVIAMQVVGVGPQAFPGYGEHQVAVQAAELGETVARHPQVDIPGLGMKPRDVTVRVQERLVPHVRVLVTCAAVEVHHGGAELAALTEISSLPRPAGSGRTSVSSAPSTATPAVSADFHAGGSEQLSCRPAMARRPAMAW